MSEMTREEYRAQVIQGGQVVATAYGTDSDAVWREGEHYRYVYSLDGPAELKVAHKNNKRWRVIGGVVPVRRAAMIEAKLESRDEG